MLTQYIIVKIAGLIFIGATEEANSLQEKIISIVDKGKVLTSSSQSSTVDDNVSMMNEEDSGVDIVKNENDLNNDHHSLMNSMNESSNVSSKDIDKSQSPSKVVTPLHVPVTYTTRKKKNTGI